MLRKIEHVRFDLSFCITHHADNNRHSHLKCVFSLLNKYSKFYNDYDD